MIIVVQMGGSGGGCSDDNNVIPGRGVQNQEGSNGYGNRGGFTRLNNKGGTGGGGAGEVGFDLDPSYGYGEANSVWSLLGRDGGNGVGSTIRTGSTQYYGGGGGGAQRVTSDDDVPVAGVGGKGGGGTGGSGNGTTGGTGGTGTVIIRMPTVNYALLGGVTGSPTIGTSGSDTILQFTGSGTLKV